jgi:outer membrane protein OmpA-like peptidoglycan-associated protein
VKDSDRVCINDKEMKGWACILILIFGFGIAGYSQNNQNAILFPATPNPADDHCLVRMYLPDSDPKAELRLLNKDNTVVKSIDLSDLKGIQSTTIILSDIARGKYVCQLVYKGIVTQSIVIFHSTSDIEPHPFDSITIYHKLQEIDLRERALDVNIGTLIDYDSYLDSMYKVQQVLSGKDSLMSRINQLSREIARLRLRFESFDQLLKELAILKVRNKPFENPMKKGTRYTLTKIYFNTGSYDFAEKSRPELDDLVEVLNEFPSLVIRINGHTDNMGNYHANVALSKSRAKSIYQYLIEKGINEERLSFDGYGSNYPLTPNITDEDRAINRRVEFIILKE